MSEEHREISVSDDSGVRTVVIDRPDVRNALDHATRLVLAEVLEQADDDPSVRAVVLTGAGATFCGGGDIATMRRRPAAEAAPLIHSAQRVARAISGRATPVVAAVEGAAFGAGMSLAIACDRVVAGRGAKFGCGFLGIGLAADGGVLWSLPRRVGAARARQMLLLGDVLEGELALATGLVDVVVDDGAALTRAVADARRLAQAPPRSLALLKTSFVDPPATLDAALDTEVMMQVELMDTDDFVEGITAFTEKRRPVFRGR